MDNNLEVWQDGMAKPCCIYQGSWGNLANYESILDSQKKLINTLDTTHAPCNQCWTHERDGITSKRQTGAYVQSTMPGINTLEIKLSNLCNLACTTCGSESSSIWANKLNVVAETNQFTKFGSADRLTAMINLIEKRKVNNIRLLGGEPTLNPETWALLDKLIELGWNEHIRIELITNGVHISKFILKYVDKFKFSIALSLDGMGEVYEYMRWGGKWTDILDTLKLLSYGSLSKNPHELNLAITYTYSVLNAFHYTEFKQWADEELPGLLNHPQWTPPVGIHLNRVDWPIELEARIVKMSMLQQLHPDIKPLVIHHISDKSRRPKPLRMELAARDIPRGISYKNYKLNSLDSQNINMIIGDESMHYALGVSDARAW